MQTRRDNLAAQVAALERQLRQLLLSGRPWDSDDNSLGAVATAKPPAGRSDLERLLYRAIRSKVLLREENAALRRQFMHTMQQRVRLFDMLRTEHNLCVSYASYFVVLKPLTSEQCRTVHDEGDLMVKIFLAQTIKNNWVRTIRGWSEGRAIHGGVYNYIFQKTFRGYSAADLCDRSYTLLSEPMGLARFYTADQKVSLRILQRVDDDNVAFFEEMVLEDTPEQLVLSKAIVLVARVAVPSGFRVYVRCLNFDDLGEQCRYETTSTFVTPLPGQSVKEIWAERVQWIQFDTRGDDCVVSYAGIIPTDGASVVYWINDLVPDTLRWEIAVKMSPFQVAT